MIAHKRIAVTAKLLGYTTYVFKTFLPGTYSVLSPKGNAVLGLSCIIGEPSLEHYEIALDMRGFGIDPDSFIDRDEQ